MESPVRLLRSSTTTLLASRAKNRAARSLRANLSCAVTTGTPKLSPPLVPPPKAASDSGSLIARGVDVIRLNMAHGSGEWVTALVKRIREVSEGDERHVAVMMDVKGPEIRTGVVAEADRTEDRGGISSFSPLRPARASAASSVNYPGLPGDVSLGATVLVDSGLIRHGGGGEGRDARSLPRW